MIARITDDLYVDMSSIRSLHIENSCCSTIIFNDGTRMHLKDENIALSLKYHMDKYMSFHRKTGNGYMQNIPFWEYQHKAILDKT